MGEEAALKSNESERRHIGEITPTARVGVILLWCVAGKDKFQKNLITTPGSEVSFELCSKVPIL